MSESFPSSVSLIPLGFLELDACALGDHGCEHSCVSSEDTFVCQCFEGYILREDGKTCRSKFLLVLAHITVPVPCMNSTVPVSVNQLLPNSVPRDRHMHCGILDGILVQKNASR